MRIPINLVVAAAAASVLLAGSPAALAEGTNADHAPGTAAIVAHLDTQYQAAVKHNDPEPIERILADDFVIVTGRGTTFTKADILHDARTASCTYEKQDEVAGTQTVRVWSEDTATVTALLSLKYSCTDGSVFDGQLWFSDTYVRRDGRWHYAFGQSSRPL
jgi:hypothetical protein